MDNTCFFSSSLREKSSMHYSIHQVRLILFQGFGSVCEFVLFELIARAHLTWLAPGEQQLGDARLESLIVSALHLIRV